MPQTLLLPLRVIEPEDPDIGMNGSGAILVADAAHNDVAEFLHSRSFTVGQTYDEALALARLFVRFANLFGDPNRCHP